MGLTHEQTACIADPERIWQVRRLCQVRYATSRASWRGHKPSQAAYGGDPALSALLRCLLYELQADTGAISLLDDQDQHFLAVAHAADSDNPDIRRADWFGCEQIPIRGGICEKTITQEQQADDFPVYEILDLKADESTRSLPVVDGRTAEFGYYAGVPLTTKDGLNVGALFVFKKDPQTEPLPMAKRRCLAGTAQHVIDQMMRAVAALENSWSLRCSLAVSSIAHSEEQFYPSSGAIGTGDQAESIPSSPSQLFELAARQLSQFLDLESVTLQELPRSDTAIRIDIATNDAICAGYTAIPGQAAEPVDDAIATQLWQAFPSGVVLHLDSPQDGGTFLASATDDGSRCQRLKISLCDRFPGIQQCVFMPLRDTFHDKDTAFILGWTSDRKRVYSSMTDLPSLSSFGIAVMAHLRRLQAQVLSRKKADFLASVSHEMRSPLHGLLACIASLNDTDCTAAQVDLLETAEACGMQLQNNIDNVLQYSKIGTASPRECPHEQNSAALQTSLAPISEPDPALDGTSGLVTFVEDVVEKLARKHQILKSLQMHELSAQPSNPAIAQDSCRNGANSLITIDAARDADFILSNITETRLIIDNLLDNCLKFTSAGGCIRIHIEADHETVHMKFADSGRGMPPDFARYGALEPFTQQDPLDDGIGLGLSLVRNAVQALNGEMGLDTDTQTGTRVSIDLPRSQLTTTRPVCALEDPPEDLPMDDERGHLAGRSAWLFEPGQWKDPHSARHAHCRRSLTDSLSCNLRSWLNIDLDAWKSVEDLPTYLIVFHADLDKLREEIGSAFEASRKIIICPDLQAQTTLSPAELGIFATLTSPLTPSKLRAAISKVDRISQDQSSISSTGHNQIILEAQQTDLENSIVRIEAATLSAEPRQNSTTPSIKSDAILQLHIEHALVSSPALQPKLLLVDDNAINLRVVGMYAKKCSKGPFSLASGGQQAIDLFNDAWATCDHETSSAFNIIFLDLSMPEVSGFDVAAAIRNTERSDPCRPRTYIAALTGLVSDKDRRAAFEAGVDEYVTKPATIKDFKSVIANWRIANGS